eukprot:CAMPEP_0183520470 /NCGR_PEP_ID=MMETSP0371-20130417/16944_1 /TAXON_ID=268820 /ORGANISM="Peridinium aciculiferum, Strain PAER-2" /LENGTH=144 /DNA_ID=CAMNT_0025718841 /DNA_START=165 /DNA_END=597 /DNA_ORIENTATION=-
MGLRAQGPVPKHRGWALRYAGLCGAKQRPRRRLCRCALGAAAQRLTALGPVPKHRGRAHRYAVLCGAKQQPRRRFCRCARGAAAQRLTALRSVHVGLVPPSSDMGLRAQGHPQLSSVCLARSASYFISEPLWMRSLASECRPMP